MSTKTNTSGHEQESYRLMVDDYLLTKYGDEELAPYKDGLMETSDKSSALTELRSTLGYFGVAEAGLTPEEIARDIEIPVDVLRSELELDDRLIQLTQNASDRLKKPFDNEPDVHHFTINTKVLGWLSQNLDGVQVQTEEITSKDIDGKPITYRFVDLTSFHKVTRKAMEQLSNQNVLETLMNTIKYDDIPRLENSVKNGNDRHFRPVNMIDSKEDGDRTVRTAYPAYKFGVQGTNNRAVLLLLGEDNGMKIYGLASLCDRAEQDAIIKAMS